MTLDKDALEAAAMALNAEEACWSGVNVWTNDGDGISDEAKDEYRRLAPAAITAYIAAIEPELRERVRAYGEAAMEYQAAPEGADFLAALKVESREHHIYALLGLEAE